MNLANETDTAKRPQLERGVQYFKSQIEELNRKEQQQHEYEAQLNTQLTLAQATLADFNERLDTLQHELETLMNADKPQQQSGKRPDKN